MRAIVPHTIMVKVTINDNLAEELQEAGFNHYQPAQPVLEKPEQREARHTASALERGVDPLRFATGTVEPNIVDGAVQGNTMYGRVKADSGTPVFGRQGQRTVSLTHTIGDIRAQFPNFALVSLNVQKRPLGKNLLWLIFSEPTETRKAINPSGAERFHLDEIVDRIYQFCHVWRNPLEGTITINVSAPMSDDVTGAKDLRIYEQAKSIRCVPR